MKHAAFRTVVTAMLFITVFLLLPVLIPAASSAFAHDTSVNPDAESLKGITTVFVVVESLGDEAKALGLDENDIQTDVELRLRLAGMRVVSASKGEAMGVPYLYANVTVLKRAASIEIGVKQTAVLKRNGELVMAATWDTGGLAEYANADFIRIHIKDYIDAFLNDWLSVNPKRSATIGGTP